jgi:hypothetical protein
MFCEFEVSEGSLGINIAEQFDDPIYRIKFMGFNGNSSTAQLTGGKLQQGMVLTHINGRDVGGVRYAEVRFTANRTICVLILVPTHYPQARGMLGQRPCKIRWRDPGCTLLITTGRLGLSVRNTNLRGGNNLYAVQV